MKVLRCGKCQKQYILGWNDFIFNKILTVQKVCMLLGWEAWFHGYGVIPTRHIDLGRVVPRERALFRLFSLRTSWVEFTWVYSLVQCWNRGSLALSNGLSLSCTDQKLLLFSLKCFPSKDLTMMHFGLYSSQSSFCRECSLASFFCLNLSGTFVSELPLIVSQRSYREAGMWIYIYPGRMQNICFLKFMKKESFWSSALAMVPSQMSTISIWYDLIWIQISLKKKKIRVRFLILPTMH